MSHLIFPASSKQITECLIFELVLEGEKQLHGHDI